jgi:hypothetical protein
MNLEVGGTFSFSVYPVAVLGTNFKNVLVLSILSAATAQALGEDIYARHALIAPSLPDTIQKKDPTKYKYVQIKLPSGVVQILAMEWINVSTIEAVNLGRHTVIIDNESSSSRQKILECLAANGFKVKSIDFESTSTMAA